MCVNSLIGVQFLADKLFNNFYFGIFLDVWKSWKDIAAFLYTPHLVAPDTNILIL